MRRGDPADSIAVRGYAALPQLRQSRVATVATGIWLAVVGCGLTFFVLHVTVNLGGSGLNSFASNWVYDGLELAAALAVGARAVLVPAERPAWLLMAIGVMSWTLGDISWTLIYAGHPPFPSLADVFYLGYYPPSYVALALLVRFRLSRFNASVWLDGVMAALAIASLGAAILLEVILRQTHGGLLSDATNLAYPLGDIVLLALLAGVFALAGWRPGWGWATIAAALVVNVIADSVYLYQTAVGTYVSGTILDALWPLSLLLLAYAAWAAPTRQARLALEGRPLAATPIVCGTIALAVLVDSYLQHRNLVGVVLATATLATMIARTLVTFGENARMTAQASVLARTDPLTGLSNRRQLVTDLAAVLDNEEVPDRVLVLYDLNGFKMYNDTFGHPAGDALLVRLANKLARSLPPGSGCYRLGGDEFCVLASVAGADTERILSDTTAALGEKGEGFDISTSFGCVFLPDEATDSSAALHVADQRLYAQKYQSHLRNGQPHRVLLQALFEREPHLQEHVSGVARLSLLVARELSLDERALEQVELAAQLHDIGKLAIPDATLERPGPLDEDEWALIHNHTAVGERILNASPAFSEVAKIIRATHERWDGHGYPDRLVGAAIPIAARIITVCDAYSAMTTERPYRPSVGHVAAIAELRRCAETQFDPDVVAAFERIHTAETRLSPLAGAPATARTAF